MAGVLLLRGEFNDLSAVLQNLFFHQVQSLIFLLNSGLQLLHLSCETFNFLISQFSLFLFFGKFLFKRVSLFLMLREQLVLMLDVMLIVLLNLCQQVKDDRFLPSNDLRPNFGANGDTLG
jgi:hypothetical protein